MSSEERFERKEGNRPPRPPQFSPGDWECQKCSNVNFARRDKCNRCDEPRPGEHGRREKGRSREPRHREDVERESTAASGRSSLFTKDDWKCPMCGNINWSRRDKCNLCNLDKPGGSNESRDGIGGGFSERQIEEENERKRRRDAEALEREQRKRQKQRCEVCKRYACLC